MEEVKKVLNPNAPEFIPTGKDDSCTIRPPPTVAYTPAAAVAVVYYHHYYHHHHHHHLMTAAFSKLQLLYPPPTTHYHFPKSDDLEGLGVITSPSPSPSPTSPLSPTLVPIPLPHQHHFRNIKKPNPNQTRVNKTGQKKLKWVKKKQSLPHEPEPKTTQIPAEEEQEQEQGSEVVAREVPLASYPFGDCTSLMIRNIPVRLSRNELMEMLDAHCRSQNQNQNLPPSQPASQFDFLYLPIDFKRKGNLGYAFVNFTTWEGASRLYNSWRGTTWKLTSYNTSKICQIYRAKYQGDELIKHFETSVFQCESKEFLPVELAPPRDGSNGDSSAISTIGKWICRASPHRLLH